MKRDSRKSSFIPGIEGLRAFSVIGVILFHLWPKIFAGGFAGVTVFFVISGFLMIRIILNEFYERGRFRIKRFYSRRFWRLYPAFIVMIFLTTAVLAVAFPEGLFGIRGSLLSNIFYVNNWYQIANSLSYFAASAHWSVFTHLWSLSVEAQFYLFWPLLLSLILYFGDKRWQLALIVPTIFALISTTLFAILYSPISTNRAYYGTDTRVFSFIIGGIVAIFMSLAASPYCPKQITRILIFFKKTSVYLISLSLLGLIALFILANGVQAWVYYFGMLLLSIFTAILIFYLSSNPQSEFGLLMGNRYFRYIGSRSYSIYLYQLPIMMIIERIFPVVSLLDDILRSITSVLIILFVSELSYRLIEMPFRHGFVLRLTKLAFNWKTILSITVAVFAIGGTAFGLISKSAVRSKDADQLQQKLNKSSKVIEKRNNKAVQARKSSSSSTSSASSSSDSHEQQLTSIFGTSSENIHKVESLNITAVGDSLLLDVGPDIQWVMPKTIFNAKVGRHTLNAIDILRHLKKEGKLDPIILMVIGTNGEISAQNIQEVRSIAGSRQVYWVNSFSGGKPWEGPNNQLLNAAAKKDRRLHIVDWYDSARSHPEWFSPDGIHPQRTGNRIMTTMIINSIASNTK
ncbi:acyltransferase family protein [Oenococcus oeni]|uniref:acyltransferase family protein n=5 Tax=Oenococcus oeni TaxID=1247 RepID=UPI0008F96D6A|nr:acyltransferase family protein [Oenococcus oeni]OIK63279.1 acyltransferase [Oenococcus oeni]OIK81715.1 acyltransferase [Oenococcus oeni]OIL90777.1 acyltransferase [Oenococcus oeni]OIM66634.1 acyltransferase [Oenococcus oeni]